MSLIKSRLISQLFVKNNAVLYTAIRNHWNKDYKPQLYPKTQEEREAAAEKYGLVVSEYEPYPDDGTGLGDYPKLPAISGEAKDPWYPWDFPENKRNFGETLHAQADFMGEDRYDVSAKLRLPGWVLWAQFLGVLGGSFAIYCIMEQCKMFPAHLPKQYPSDGKVHYTFEPNE